MALVSGQVTADDRVAVIAAMKMDNPVTAHHFIVSGLSLTVGVQMCGCTAIARIA